MLVGGPMRGRAVIIDDVITAGTAVRESIELIRAAGAQPVAVALALDRQERGQRQLSAVQEMQSEYGVQTVSIVTLADLIDALSGSAGGSGRISAEQLSRLARLSRTLRRHLTLRPASVEWNIAA